MEKHSMSWIARKKILLLNGLFHPKQSTYSMQSLSKITPAFFTELERTTIKFVWNQTKL